MTWLDPTLVAAAHTAVLAARDALQHVEAARLLRTAGIVDWDGRSACETDLNDLTGPSEDGGLFE